MRAIVIYNRGAVEEVAINNYKDYYKHLDAGMFDVVRVRWLGRDISIFVDDEGMLKRNFGRDVIGYPQPLFGNLVICGGVDHEGETLPLDKVFTTKNMHEFVSNIKYMIEG